MDVELIIAVAAAALCWIALIFLVIYDIVRRERQDYKDGLGGGPS